MELLKFSIGYVFKQLDDLQPNLFVNNTSERLDGLDINNEDNLSVEPEVQKFIGVGCFK